MRLFHIVTATAAGLLAQAANAMPQNIQWIDYGGHSYGLTEPMTWLDAEALAQTYGGHLMTVNDEVEGTDIFYLLDVPTQPGGSVYIGFNDIDTEGNWVWASGEPVTYTNWQGGEPNNHPGNPSNCQSPGDPGEDAAMMGHGGTPKWWDAPYCYEEYRAIIETDHLIGGWEPAPPFNIPRAGAVVVEHGGDLYLAGGDTLDCGGTPQIAEVERFDGEQWTIVTSMPNGGRSGLRAVSMDGFIYFLGGFVPQGQSSDEVWRYEPCTDEWTEGESMPGHRVNMGVVACDGKILVIGGRSWPGWTYHSTVFVYDPVLDSWSNGVEHPGRQDGFPLGDNAAVGVSGRVMVLGGMSGTGSFSDAYDEFWLMDMWRKTPSTVSTLMAPLPEPLFGAQAEAIGKTLIVLGGHEAWNGSGYYSNDQMHVYYVSPSRIGYRFSQPLPDYPMGSAILDRGEDARLYLIGTNDGWGTCPSTACWSLSIQ